MRCLELFDGAGLRSNIALRAHEFAAERCDRGFAFGDHRFLRFGRLQHFWQLNFQLYGGVFQSAIGIATAFGD